MQGINLSGGLSSRQDQKPESLALTYTLHLQICSEIFPLLDFFLVIYLLYAGSFLFSRFCDSMPLASLSCSSDAYIYCDAVASYKAIIGSRHHFLVRNASQMVLCTPLGGIGFLFGVYYQQLLVFVIQIWAVQYKYNPLCN